MIKYILKPKPSELKSLAKKYFELDYSDKNVLKEKARNFVKEKGCLNKKIFYERINMTFLNLKNKGEQSFKKNN